MKRIYYCFALLLVLYGIIWYGKYCMDGFQIMNNQTIEGARACLERYDYDEAVLVLSDGVEQLRTQEHRMAIFVRREILAKLEETLCAALCYAQQENKEETFAELARAESQLYSMEHQFSRMV